jgi:chaperonin GroEL (HSP60 family)
MVGVYYISIVLYCLSTNFALFTDMREHFVIDPLISKRQQLLLATQLCRMVLKVNNVIISGSGEDEF